MLIGPIRITPGRATPPGSPRITGLVLDQSSGRMAGVLMCLTPSHQILLSWTATLRSSLISDSGFWYASQTHTPTVLKAYVGLANHL